MLTKILSNSKVQTLLLFLLVAGVGICILPDYLPQSFRIAEKFAVQIMIGYLLGGILFLMLKQPKLMFASFGCCAALAIFLKFSTSPRVPYYTKKVPKSKAEQTKPQKQLKIAHFISQNKFNIILFNPLVYNKTS